jgi:hypothetical protein
MMYLLIRFLLIYKKNHVNQRIIKGELIAHRFNL